MLRIWGKENFFLLILRSYGEEENLVHFWRGERGGVEEEWEIYSTVSGIEHGAHSTDCRSKMYSIEPSIEPEAQYADYEREMHSIVSIEQ